MSTLNLSKWQAEFKTAFEDLKKNDLGYFRFIPEAGLLVKRVYTKFYPSTEKRLEWSWYFRWLGIELYFRNYHR